LCARCIRSNNAALAALASLLAEEVLEEDNNHHPNCSKDDITAKGALHTGGGKVTPRHEGKRLFNTERHKPYDLKNMDRKEPTTSASTTVSEAQLFMRLWKI
jgi:hypothetical protein